MLDRSSGTISLFDGDTNEFASYADKLVSLPQFRSHSYSQGNIPSIPYDPYRMAGLHTYSQFNARRMA
ncbi:MAG: hypothetical protein HY863_01225 [Chloroflexi bacterium]|nr:hypothetical protein [Chloroflexota bacterium]